MDKNDNSIKYKIMICNWYNISSNEQITQRSKDLKDQQIK